MLIRCRRSAGQSAGDEKSQCHFSMKSGSVSLRRITVHRIKTEQRGIIAPTTENLRYKRNVSAPVGKFIPENDYRGYLWLRIQSGKMKLLLLSIDFPTVAGVAPRPCVSPRFRNCFRKSFDRGNAQKEMHGFFCQIDCMFLWSISRSSYCWKSNSRSTKLLCTGIPMVG